MPTSFTPPCSLDRLARPRWLAILVFSASMLAWTSHATRSLTAAESELIVADPPLCLEPHTNGETTATDILLTHAPKISSQKTAETEVIVPEVIGPEVLVPEVIGPEVIGPDVQFQRSPTLPVTKLSANIKLPAGILPDNVAALHAATTPARGDNRLFGRWAMSEHHWSATGLRHRPLYFEDVNLERYGYSHSYVFQPLISAARFFGTIPALPYKMVLERPRQYIYTLGRYRPGSRAPWHWQRLPLHAGAGLVEAGVVVGLVFLIP